MNIPFSFALSETNLYGVLWNPFATALSGSVANAILAALDQDERRVYDIVEPTAHVRVTGYNVQTDAADAELSFGIYDTVAGAFVELQPVFATEVAAGGLVRTMEGGGFLFPCSATKLAVIKYTPAMGSANVTGDIEISVQQDWTLPADGQGAVIPTNVIQDEDGATVFDEASPSLAILNE